MRGPYLPAAAAGPRANSRRRPRGKLSPGRRGALATCSVPAAFPAVAAAAARPGTDWREAAAALAPGSGLGARGWGSGGLARLRGGSLGAASAPQPGAPESPAAAAAARPPAGPTSPPPLRPSLALARTPSPPRTSSPSVSSRRRRRRRRRREGTSPPAGRPPSLPPGLGPCLLDGIPASPRGPLGPPFALLPFLPSCPPPRPWFV